ncbi:MAG: hypothetical protein ACHQUB_03680 [Candidatus Saccharimonadia bacterium]
MNVKLFLGITAVIVGLIGYAPYFRNIIIGKTKPHAFSWLVWGILTGIAFVGQITSQGGFGTWVTGFTAFICILIFTFALWKGSKDFPISDWLCLAGAGIALVLWVITKSALTAILLVSIIDALGFIPTFRKSYLRPNEETVFTYIMSGFKFIIGIVALNKLSPVTVIYPCSIIITNLLFVVMVQIRRQQLGRYTYSSKIQRF